MIERLSKDTYKLLDTETTELMYFMKYKHVNKKTFEIEIWSGYDALGTIKWFPAWRSYVFFPEQGCIFDSSCLKEITKYIDDLMEARKK